MRLFLAINFPENVREHLRLIQTTLRQQITAPANWTRADQFHITVKFLGNCDESKFQSLLEITKKTTLPNVGSMRATALQIFPPRRPARVLGAKLESDEPSSLQIVHQELETIAADLDFPREERDFHPHVTFARMRIPKRIPDTIQESVVQNFPGPEFTPVSIDMMESKLSAQGSRYTRLASIALR